MAKRRKRQANPGAELRAMRQQLGLSFRDVYAASLDIAEQCRQPAFEIAPSRLHEIESTNMIPSIHPAASDVASEKWYSLCTLPVGESRPHRRFQALSRNPNQIQSHSPGRNQ